MNELLPSGYVSATQPEIPKMLEMIMSERLESLTRTPGFWLTSKCSTTAKKSTVNVKLSKPGQVNKPENQGHCW